MGKNYDIRSVILHTQIHPLVIFGAGFRFSTVAPLLIERKISFVVTDNDKKKHGSTLSNALVISPQEVLEKHKRSWICISVFESPFYDEILEQLMNMGFSSSKIVDLRELIYHLEGVDSEKINEVNGILEDKESKEVFAALCCFSRVQRLYALRKVRRNINEQYFDPDIIKLGINESFVDAGGFIGDTIQAFIKYSVNRFNVIHSFEPSEANFTKIINDYSYDIRIIIRNLGLSDKKSNAGFNDKGFASAISENGQAIIQVDTLDNIINNECVSFIKMDIEGSELDALFGAKRTICNCRPKLAICVYHRDMDIFNITEYLQKCVPEYKFYLRHYTYGFNETVLYAVVG